MAVSEEKKLPMKILFFHIMKENFSGAQKNIFRLLLNLDRDIVEPVLIGQTESPLTFLCKQNQIPVDIVDFPPGLKVYDGGLLRFRIRTLLNFAKSLYFYNKTLIKNFDFHKPDAVWADNIRTFFTVFVACKLSGVKIIWNIWSEPKGIVSWFLHRLGLFLADKINVEYSKQPPKLFGYLVNVRKLQKKIVPLYTGVSDFESIQGIDIRKELSIPEDALLLIMASNIIAGKGQLDLVKSSENILKGNPNIYLLICGSPVESNHASGMYYEEIQTYIEENELEDSIFLLGWRSDIRDLYQQSNVYISTSYSESFPDSVREAMLASLPVIVTDVGGTNELVEEGMNGYLFKPGDIETLTNYMMNLIKDKNLRISMGKRSKSIIEDKFSTKAYAKDFEEMAANLIL